MDTIPPQISLAVSKAERQMRWMSDSLSVKILPEPAASLRSDLEQMLLHGDLTSISLQLLGLDGKLIFEYEISFNGPSRSAHQVDSARGIELPVIDRRRVTGGRLVVSRNGLEAKYRHLLKLSWSTAERLERAQADSVDSEHARKISGNRQQGTFRVAQTFRHRLVVLRGRISGYWFARSLDEELPDIFVHPKFVEPGCQLFVGAKVTALVISSPRGPQARSVRSA